MKGNNEYNNSDASISSNNVFGIPISEGVGQMSQLDEDAMRDTPDEVEKKATLNYHSKLVGVTFEGRQDIIKVLKGDEKLRARREVDNQYDKNAVAIDVEFGETWLPIGYIAKDKNQKIADTLDAGEPVYIAISDITGGDDKSFGVNVEIEFTPTKKKVAPAPVAAEPVVERVLGPKEELMLAVDKFMAEFSGLGVKELYTSRLTGKTTEVTVTNGHISLPGYLSGSTFPKAFYAPFNQEDTLQKIVDKHFKEEQRDKAKQDLLTMWGLNRDASTGYGTAVHAALENYDTYHRLGDKTKKVETFKTKPAKIGPNKALSRNPFLKKIVEDFHEKYGGDYIRLSEQFVWIHEAKLCGSIDRVKVINPEEKLVRIQDYKTDGDIHEKTYQLKESPFYQLTQGTDPTLGKELLDLHWLQLSFYAHILKAYGYTVEGLDVYWLNPDKLCKGENAWEEFSHDVIDISKAL